MSSSNTTKSYGKTKGSNNGRVSTSPSNKKARKGVSNSYTTTFSTTQILMLIVVVGLSLFFAKTWKSNDHVVTITSFSPYPTTYLVADHNRVNKYHTDYAIIEPRSLMDNSTCLDENYMPQLVDVATENDDRSVYVIPVTKAMDNGEKAQHIFFMLNGENTGIYVHWNSDYSCIHRTAFHAAKWLGADADELQNGIRLYSQYGEPVRSYDDLKSTNFIVHILIDFQLWIWPGIELGHKYKLENGIVLTTMSLTPKVFDVENFFTRAEANHIMEVGIKTLNRSHVDGASSSKIVSGSRTSHTSFFPEGVFARDFRKRSTKLARLPSATHGERLQLVRYRAGEFYRKHFDTFHSREILTNDAKKAPSEYAYKDYVTWAQWAADTIVQIHNEGVVRIPHNFQPGKKLFPIASDRREFPNSLVKLFYDSAHESNYFIAHGDKKWGEWLATNLGNNAGDIMDVLLKEENRQEYLPLIVREWEKAIGLPQLRYTFPKNPKWKVNGVTHIFRWIRWAKERISYLGDEIPMRIRPGGELYPRSTIPFHKTLHRLVLENYTEEYLAKQTTKDWVKWMKDNAKTKNPIQKVLQAFPHMAEVVIRAWEAQVGAPESLRYTVPLGYVRHFHPQRFVTLFLYLNEEPVVAGETVFPYSNARYPSEDNEADAIDRSDMRECAEGLAVPPKGLHASLFYVQTPEGIPDKLSIHGGCPPKEGVKWGSNSFMWDTDSEEGSLFWTAK